MLRLGAEAERAGAGGRSGAWRAGGTGRAGFPLEQDLHDVMSVRILPFYPRDTDSSLRTVSDPVLPIDGKGRGAKRAGGFGLPTRIGQHRAEQLHIMFTLTDDDVLGTHVAGVDQMLLRQQVSFC